MIMTMVYGVVSYIFDFLIFYFIELTEAQIRRLNECRKSIEYKESNLTLLCLITIYKK